jgi:large subunit ribosomal protein L23
MSKSIHLFDVIRRPIITEKTDRLNDELNVYTFEVDVRANKPMIKEAVEEIFEVEVLRVRTTVMPPKMGQRLRKAFIRKKKWKKAYVTVVPGQSIDMFGV